MQGCGEGERREGQKCTIKDVKVNSCKNVKVKDEGAKERRAKVSEKQESSRARI